MGLPQFIERNENLMRHLPATLVTIGVVLALALTGCTSSESGEHSRESETSERSSGGESGEQSRESESSERNGGGESSEHRRESESGEHSEGAESGEGGEESGTQFTLGETFDQVRAGARLILAYDSTSNAFTGTVENTSNAKLSRVRVEVHLSNGIELGPTTPIDLAPGQVHDIDLSASSQPFKSWSAHPEVG